jgi:hypothetical protein
MTAGLFSPLSLVTLLKVSEAQRTRAWGIQFRDRVPAENLAAPALKLLDLAENSAFWDNGAFDSTSALERKLEFVKFTTEDLTADNAEGPHSGFSSMITAWEV